MSHPNQNSLESLFHPRSIALAGITVANPEHWTRTFLNSLLEFKFKGPIYLVNPRGGNIRGLEVYRKLEDIPETPDYVISTVAAQASPGLIEECARKGVKVVHFCTSGFGETGEEEGKKLEAQLLRLSREKGIRIIGPNCMGIYCPESRVSFHPTFPKESGSVGFISQSGGNTVSLLSLSMLRGVRFSKIISYGNGIDLNESDFLEYLTADPATKIIALYIEGVRDGKRFRQVLEKAAKKKTVLLLKGGISAGGARAAAGHTGSLAGSEATWEALCKQLGVIHIRSLEELADTLVTLIFMPLLDGRNIALLGVGGGSTVLVTDEFEKRGLKAPPLPESLRAEIRQYTPVAGNILSNPMDYSQSIREIDKVTRTISIISRWREIDCLIGFLMVGQLSPGLRRQMVAMIDAIVEGNKTGLKPLAIVVSLSIVPEEARDILQIIQKCVACGLPVYHSFAAAATAINLVLNYKEQRVKQAGTL